MKQNARRETLRCLEEALSRLPVLEDQRQAVRQHAEWLCISAAFGSINDQPSARRAGKKKACQSLTKLARLAVALNSQINDLPADALEEIDTVRKNAMERAEAGTADLPAAAATAAIRSRSIPHPYIVQRDLRKLVEGATLAIGRLASADETQPERPRKAGAGLVADAAAGVFKALTGRPPTRQSRKLAVNQNIVGQKETGTFVDFLAEIFDILGIQASAAGQVRLWKKRQQNTAG